MSEAHTGTDDGTRFTSDGLRTLTHKGVREHARTMLADADFRERLKQADRRADEFFRSLGIER